MGTPDLSPYRLAVAVPLDSPVSPRADPVCSNVLVAPADPAAFPFSQSLSPRCSVNSQGPTHRNVTPAQRDSNTPTPTGPLTPSTPTSHPLYDPSSASVPSPHLRGFHAPRPFSASWEGPSGPCAPWRRCSQLPPGQQTCRPQMAHRPSAFVCILLSAC